MAETPITDHRLLLEDSTTGVARRIFRRFVLVIGLVSTTFGAAMVIYDVADTTRQTSAALIDQGHFVIDIAKRLAKSKPNEPLAAIAAQAAALTDAEVALFAADGRPLYSTHHALIKRANELYQQTLPTIGDRVEITETLGRHSGAWVVSALPDGKRLLAVIGHQPGDEGRLRYMTVGAALLGLGLGIGLLVILLTARWTLQQPLSRLIEQLSEALARDIRRRERAEQQAVQARIAAEGHLAFRDRLLDASQWVGIIGTDHEERIQIYNSKAAEVLGYDADAVVGKLTIAELFAALERQPRSTLPHRSMMQPQQADERLVAAASGEEKLLHLHESVIADSAGNPLGKLVAFADITESRQLQVDLKLNELQLIQAAKMASLGEMATGVAHELNQPLNNIGLLASRIERKLTSFGSGETVDFMREKLTRMQGQIQRASKIIDQLRMLGHPGDRSLAAISIKRPVDDVIDLLQSQFKSRGIELVIDIDAAGPQALANEAQLEQVLINLLNNARDAFDDAETAHPLIEITVEHDAEHQRIALIVDDNGPGVPEEVSAKIFQPFYTTKVAGKGTGLGLSISYSLVRSFGGDLSVERSQRGGARFVISLPQALTAPEKQTARVDP